MLEKMILEAQTIIIFLLSKNVVVRLGCWGHVLVHEGANGGWFLVIPLFPDVIAMHAGKVFYTWCRGKHGTRYKINFISLKPVLTFQTLMPAMLGKWATTHDRVFFLGKNCSWTLLPGST